MYTGIKHTFEAALGKTGRAYSYSIGRQRVPQRDASDREKALSRVGRSDGGKHLETVAPASAEGRTLE